MSNDSRLDKIRALLAKAEDPASTSAEAEAYTAKAAELISKWGLEDALHEAKQEDLPSVTEKILKLSGSYQTDKADLVHCVIRGLGLRAVTITNSGPQTGGKQVHIFGMENDIVRAELLFTSLLVQAAQGLSTARPAWHSSENIKAYRRSWFRGFSQAIEARLARSRERAVSEAGPGTDLVLVDKSKLIADRVAVFYPSTRIIRRRLSGSGRNDGLAAGRRANLSTGEGQVRNDSGHPEVTR